MHILLIARHYPPEISGGARRPYLLTKALRKQGHKVTLVTPFPLNDPDQICVENLLFSRNLNQTNVADIEQSFFGRLRTTVREWLFWPDADIRWARQVIAVCHTQNICPDWILTTSPPESIHVIGRALSKSWNVPWIAELRDTWVDAPHKPLLARSSLRSWLERRLARRILGNADAITAVSEAVMSEGRRYVREGTPELIISHFSDAPPAPYDFKPGKLNLVHSGGFTLSDRRRHLRPLLDALVPVCKQRPELVLHIVGLLTAAEITIANTSTVPTMLHGRVSLEKSRALQAGADGLVLYTPPTSHALPGKYAEYSMAQRPILYMGGGEWLKLVAEPELLTHLVEGALSLTKGSVVVTQNPLSATLAASSLCDFLQKHKE